MTVFIVGVSLIVIPLTMNPVQVNAAPQVITPFLDCSGVNAKTYGDCDQVKIKSDDSFDNCYTRSYPTSANNCQIGQSVSVSNNIRGLTSQVDIYQEVKSLIDCDYGKDYCLDHTLNVGSQSVDVKTYKTSPTASLTTAGRADVDVEQELTQLISTDGQDFFDSSNIATQTFNVKAIPSTAATTSTNTAVVDADGESTSSGDPHIDMYGTQDNNECDDSTCSNELTQKYDLTATGRSSITATANQGLEAIQTNNGCDVNDDSGTMDCINTALQTVSLIAGTLPNPTTGVVADSDASITFSTNGDNNVIEQYNHCGKYGEDYTCENYAETITAATALGKSQINLEAEQDVSQTNYCNYMSPNDDCVNEAVVSLDARATSSTFGSTTYNGIINADGSQTVDQANYCYGGECLNTANLAVWLGATLTEDDQFNVNFVPVDGRLDVDYQQSVDQLNDCKDTLCSNVAGITLAASADATSSTSPTDPPSLDLNSIQSVDQSNECIDQVICSNTAFIFGSYLARASGDAVINEEQTLVQECDTSDGQYCYNNNILVTDADALGTSQVNFAAYQEVYNNDGSNDAGSIQPVDGTELYIDKSSGTYQPNYPIRQTLGDTQVTNPVNTQNPNPTS